MLGRPRLIVSLLALTVLVVGAWLALRPMLGLANPEAAFVTIGGGNDCAANFIRPCAIEIDIYYLPGDVIPYPGPPWTLDFPPGFFFAPDNEVVDRSIVGSVGLSLWFQFPGAPPTCVNLVNVDVPLYEATTKIANPIDPFSAMLDNGGYDPTTDTDLPASPDGVPDGVTRWPSDLNAIPGVSTNLIARYYGAGGHLGFDILVYRDPATGDHTLKRVLFMSPPLGSSFPQVCNLSFENYSLLGLTNDVITTPDVGDEEDQLTHSCFVPGSYNLALQVIAAFNFAVTCTTPPPPPAATPLPIPNPLPQEFIKLGMPRFGQHGHPICWAVSVSDSLWWLANHGFPGLVNEPGRPGPNTRYQNLDIGTQLRASRAGSLTSPWSLLQSPWFDDANGFRRIIRRVIQSMWRDWSGGNAAPATFANGNNNGNRDPLEYRKSSGPGDPNGFLDGAWGWDILLAYKKFLQSAGSSLAVHAIIDSAQPAGSQFSVSMISGLNTFLCRICFAERMQEASLT